MPLEREAQLLDLYPTTVHDMLKAKQERKTKYDLW
jgi:hypothetical protein